MGCSEFAQLILSSVDKQQWTQLINHDLKNALHFAPCCTKELLQLLVHGNPNLWEGSDKFGCTVFHSWAELGYVWPFEYIFQEHRINHPDWNSKLVTLLNKQDENGDNVFHYAARSKQETANAILQLLIIAFKQLDPNWGFLQQNSPMYLPWFQNNIAHDGPLLEAIKNHHNKDVALTISSQLVGCATHLLLDYYNPGWRTLFFAMENNCYQVAKNILANLSKEHWRQTPYLKDSSDDRSILHLAATCTDKEFGKWLVAEAKEFILEPDKSGKTPLDEASDVDADWLIQAMLQTNATSIFDYAPPVWIRACQNGHISAIRAFVECYPGRFRDHCVKHEDSPLHHIKLPHITRYEDFFAIPHMKNLVNFQDSNGKTPLHTAILKENIHLTEVLLNNKEVLLDVKDINNDTPRNLLQKICQRDEQWKNMCHDNGFDLSLRLTYLRRKTNLLEVRNTLSVVSALLATITFTAGFTLPGGFNQDTGEAILAKKGAFLVFIISDTLALCGSMLVLTCLIWSVVYDPDRAMFLIDRSMKLLMLSLYLTMIAFVCGVFIVISQKSMWAAILVIAICSLLAISVKRGLLYAVVDILLPSPTTSYKSNCLSLLERGKVCCCWGDNSCSTCKRTQ